LTARSLPVAFASLTLAIVCLLASRAATQSPSALLTILSKDGRRTINVTTMAGQDFVALDDLGAVFQFTTREESGAITAAYKNKTIILTLDQPLASVAGRLVPLPAAPLRAGRRVLVPIEFISRALAPILDTKLDLRKSSNLLVVGDLRVPHVTARLETTGAGARLTVDATPRAGLVASQDGQRVLVKFDVDILDFTSPSLPPQALVQAIHPLDQSTLAIDLGPRAGSVRTSTQLDGSAAGTTRLVVDVAAPVQADTQTPPPPAAATPPPSQAVEPPSAGLAGASVRTVVIDAGHGGDDAGVTSASGTKEKDITLGVARRLKAAIEGRLGIRVVLTRDDDRNPSFDERAATANNSKADLFVSLHADASFKPSVSGATIYYLAATDEPHEETQAGGRLPVVTGGSRDIELIPWDLAQARHAAQSMAFAMLTEEQFRGRVPLSAHAVISAPLRVLQSANMPAVLVEIGHLSNAEQDKQLAGAEFQNLFTQALTDAVTKFHEQAAAGDLR
jgi:N-acetylmuramoyl-L-alanine amidase